MVTRHVGVGPIFSARLERSRIVTWLRRRADKAIDVTSYSDLAEEIEQGVDVEETQDLRLSTTEYPTPNDAAFAIEGWADYTGLLDSEAVVMRRAADRIRRGT